VQATGEVLNSYTGHANDSYTVGSCFTNTDAFVASGGEDGIISFWGLVDVRDSAVVRFVQFRAGCMRARVCLRAG
jgi:hypothetical protein